MLWTVKHLASAKAILSRYPRSQLGDALAAISTATGRKVTGPALRSVFLRENFGPPTSFMLDGEWEEQEPAAPKVGKSATKKKDVVDSKEDEPSEITSPNPMMAQFVTIAKKGPIAFEALCDKLNLSPAKARRLVEEATKLGVKVHVEHNHVGIHFPEPNDQVTHVGVPPVVGVRQKVAVISDTHLGSKYCLREQLKDFIHYAYSQGVREILHPGDILDGCYKHGMWEVSHSGLDDQARDLFEVLPQLPGLTYHGITGNHDFTFTEAGGIDVGDYLSNYFKQRGRNDLMMYGNRGAFVKIRGVVVHLWHPRSGVSYARSYALQKNIEKYSSLKPQVMLAGHWHVYCHVYERGVHGIACPTFQGGGSAFSKSLGGAPAIGGLILHWDLTEHGTIRSFMIEKRSYFEHEQPVEIRNDIDAIEVGATRKDPVAPRKNAAGSRPRA